MMNSEVLALKDKLLNPKRGDKYDTWFYLDGWRLCEVTVGNRKVTVKAKHSKQKPTTYNRKEFEKELNKLYWYAARCDASRVEYNKSGKYKRKKGWERDYA